MAVDVKTEEHTMSPLDGTEWGKELYRVWNYINQIIITNRDRYLERSEAT